MPYFLQCHNASKGCFLCKPVPLPPVFSGGTLCMGGCVLRAQAPEKIVSDFPEAPLG